jgi:hypothetical protein
LAAFFAIALQFGGWQGFSSRPSTFCSAKLTQRDRWPYILKQAKLTQEKLVLIPLSLLQKF